MFKLFCLVKMFVVHQICLLKGNTHIQPLQRKAAQQAINIIMLTQINNDGLPQPQHRQLLTEKQLSILS